MTYELSYMDDTENFLQKVSVSLPDLCLKITQLTDTGCTVHSILLLGSDLKKYRVFYTDPDGKNRESVMYANTVSDAINKANGFPNVSTVHKIFLLGNRLKT